MVKEGEHDPLQTRDYRMLAILDQLRDRGVTHVELKMTNGEELLDIKCNLAPLAPLELPISQEERQRLMNDPKTPAEIRERIAQEDEEDLYGSV